MSPRLGPAAPVRAGAYPHPTAPPNGTRVAMACGMTHGTVVLAGSLPVGRVALGTLVSELGWSLAEAGSLHDLRTLRFRHSVVAVLFNPASLGMSWNRGLWSVLNAAPDALPILCHTSGENVDWTSAAEAGAFHSLLLPLEEREVRQSLGFAWSELFAREFPSLPAPASDSRHSVTVISEQLRPRKA